MSNLWKAKQELCRRLRTKAMFIDADPDPGLPNMSDGLFWCTHTFNSLGPDGQAANSAKPRVNEFRKAGGQSAKEIEKGLEAAWAELKKAFDEAAAKFRQRP